MNGKVRNHSAKTLWIVETDSGHSIARQLGPNRETGEGTNAVGFKAVDETPIDGHSAWWKLIDCQVADIAEFDGTLSSCSPCYNAQKANNDEFGRVLFDYTNNCGVSLEGVRWQVSGWYLDTNNERDTRSLLTINT